jgi:hypothetical protein
MRRRALILAGVLLTAVALGFLLRGVVNQLIVLPLAYLMWVLKLLYLSLPQVVWWIGVVLLVLFMLGFSLLSEFKPGKRQPVFPSPERGRVESLALAMNKSKNGTYFKWLVANRLGKLAYQILLQRENGKPRSVFAPLTGNGWEAEKELQDYLETGLRGSFTDYPSPAIPYVPPARTPLDQDVGEVIEFLEKQVGERSSA